jgi:hypothetical protein
MPALYEIRFLPEGRAEHFAGSRGNYYDFPDGSRIDVQTTPVWCRGCGRVTNGERVEPLDEIDRQIEAELRGQGSWCGAVKWVEVLRERRRWREARQSPPKCLTCGTTDVFVFPVNEVAPNPAGPGTVEVSTVGMCSTGFNQWFFTPEGERIPRDTKPTYWQHPALDNAPPGAVRRFLNRLRCAGRRDRL